MEQRIQSYEIRTPLEINIKLYPGLNEIPIKVRLYYPVEPEPGSTGPHAIRTSDRILMVYVDIQELWLNYNGELIIKICTSDSWNWLKYNPTECVFDSPAPKFNECESISNLILCHDIVVLHNNWIHSLLLRSFIDRPVCIEYENSIVNTLNKALIDVAKEKDDAVYTLFRTSWIILWTRTKINKLPTWNEINN